MSSETKRIGKTTTTVKPYRVVDDILILTDSQTQKMISTKYGIKGSRMTISGEGWNIVLDKI